MGEKALKPESGRHKTSTPKWENTEIKSQETSRGKSGLDKEEKATGIGGKEISKRLVRGSIYHRRMVGHLNKDKCGEKGGGGG